tara:strand:+ start:230 stop:985 length:756 start_codon:yes stop_codon:yes gene_type:complete
MSVPVVGPISVSINQTVAPGFYKIEEKTDVERFMFRWMSDDTQGQIMISGTDKMINYNREDEVYWLETPGEYFSQSEPDSNKKDDSGSLSFTFKSDDKDSPPRIERMSAQNIEIVNGYRAKKWITRVLFDDKKIIIEEWFVKDLPLLDLQDSIKRKVFEDFSRDIEFSGNNNLDDFLGDEWDMMGLSNTIISEMDTITDLDQIQGKPVKTNVLFFEDKKNPKIKMSMEILELYAESVDTAFFTIPDNFKKK